MSIGQLCCKLLFAVMFSGTVLSSALAREWKPTAARIASDYAEIVHAKSKTDFVRIKWWAEPIFTLGTPIAGLLRTYILISVIHFHIDPPSGTLSTEYIDELEVRDSSGTPLAPVARDAMPPVLIGTLTSIETSVRQSAGRLAQGYKFFVFDAGKVRACENGRIVVPLAGETYTWETPFPGCSKLSSEAR